MKENVRTEVMIIHPSSDQTHQTNLSSFPAVVSSDDTGERPAEPVYLLVLVRVSVILHLLCTSDHEDRNGRTVLLLVIAE